MSKNTVTATEHSHATLREYAREDAFSVVREHPVFASVALVEKFDWSKAARRAARQRAISAKAALTVFVHDRQREDGRRKGRTGHMSHFDVAYNDLIDRVLTHGARRPTRAKLESTGQHIDAITLFGHDGSGGLSLVAPAIHDEFPLLTTKRVWFHGVKHELLWMLSGSTNVRDLQAAKVRIWNQWADENGELGAVYGAQWRAWNGKVDQIQGLLDGIAAVKSDPHASVGRRIILTGWNVEKIPEMALPPCHTLAQWDVRPAPAEQSGWYLDCALYMRSCDAFLGLPFNAAQYALLTALLANLTGMTPGALTIHFGNLHVYSNHQESLLIQRGRDRHHAPRVRIIGEIDPTLRNVDPDAIDLQGYVSGDPLPGEVAV